MQSPAKRFLSNFVRIVEVGPRDGLQNEKIFVPTHTKIELINRLSHTGLSSIEVTSFVSPKWVPQMSDASTVYTSITKHQHVQYSCLVPNMHALKTSLSLKVPEIAIFVSSTDAFSQKNINCTVDDSLASCKSVIAEALRHGVMVRAYVSCVLGCPYSGPVSPQVVKRITHLLLQMGCYQVSLGDTIGSGTPGSMRTLLDVISESVGLEKVAVHCHDTYGMALANVLAALDKGVRVVDSSVSGLGGCPYAKGSSGNLATEDLVYMLDGLGFKHGVQLDKLIEVGNYISKQLQRENGSRVSRAITAKM